MRRQKYLKTVLLASSLSLVLLRLPARSEIPKLFYPSVNLSGINTPFVERDPSLTADGLEIYFRSDRPGGVGGADIWCATRTGRHEDFATAFCVTSVCSLGDEHEPNISPDGLTLYFVRDWPGHTALADLYVSHRVDRYSAFSTAVPISELNTPDQDGYPFVSADGLSIYWASAFAISGPANEDLYFANRPDTSSPFGLPINLSELNTEDNERNPWVSGDELSIYFASRESPADPFSIYAAERASVAAPFGPRIRVTGFNLNSWGASPFYDAVDGLLYFNVPGQLGGLGSNDIWVASPVPEPAPLWAVGLGGVLLLRARGRKWPVEKRTPACVPGYPTGSGGDGGCRIDGPQDMSR